MPSNMDTRWKLLFSSLPGTIQHSISLEKHTFVYISFVQQFFDHTATRFLSHTFQQLPSPLCNHAKLNSGMTVLLVFG
jgi:hypothetical protein